MIHRGIRGYSVFFVLPSSALNLINTIANRGLVHLPLKPLGKASSIELLRFLLLLLLLCGVCIDFTSDGAKRDFHQDPPIGGHLTTRPSIVATKTFDNHR